MKEFDHDEQLYNTLLGDNLIEDDNLIYCPLTKEWHSDEECDPCEMCY